MRPTRVCPGLVSQDPYRCSMTWADEPFTWSQLDAIVGLLTAAATLATVAVALWIAVRERTERQASDARSALLEARDQEREERERKRLTAIEERETRAQASRVIVHPSATDPYTVQVNNSSDLPVFDATVYAAVPRTGSDLKTDRTSVGLVRPGQPSAVTINWEKPLVGYAALVVTFRDANDVMWLRSGTGTLERLPADPSAAEQLIDARFREQWTDESLVLALRWFQRVGDDLP